MVNRPGIFTVDRQRARECLARLGQAAGVVKREPQPVPRQAGPRIERDRVTIRRFGLR